MTTHVLVDIAGSHRQYANTRKRMARPDVVQRFMDHLADAHGLHTSSDTEVVTMEYRHTLRPWWVNLTRRPHVRHAIILEPRDMPDEVRRMVDWLNANVVGDTQAGESNG